MIRIEVQKGENIEKALKRFKKKFQNTKILKEIRERQEFIKNSVKKRKQKIKAIYIQKLRNKANI